MFAYVYHPQTVGLTHKWVATFMKKGLDLAEQPQISCVWNFFECDHVAASLELHNQPISCCLKRKIKVSSFKCLLFFFTNSRSEMSKSLTSKSSGTTSRRPTHFTLKIRSPLTLPFWGPHFQTPPVISYLVGGAITILKNMKYICVLQFSNFHGTKEYEIYDGK